MMDETDPSDHDPCNSKQPEFPEVARCWCRAEQGRGKAEVLNPSRTFLKLEIPLPRGW